MEEEILNHLNTLIGRYPELSSQKSNILNAYHILENCFF